MFVWVFPKPLFKFTQPEFSALGDSLYIISLVGTTCTLELFALMYLVGKVDPHEISPQIMSMRKGQTKDHMYM